MVDLGPSTYWNEQAKLNQLLERLIEAMEVLLNVLLQRNVVVEKERKTYQLLVDTKYAMLQSKMKFQVEVQTKLAATDIKLTQVKENYNSGAQFTLKEGATNEGPTKKNAKRAQGARTMRQH